MFCFKLITILGLAAASLLMTAGLSAAQSSTPLSKNKVTTCDSLGNVHRLSCASGVIEVQAALYGRMDSETCSEGRPVNQLTDINCSQEGTLDVTKAKCDGKRVCEVNADLYRTSDPCFGTYKYVETTYACIPATHSVTCEQSYAHLRCDEGQVIQVFAANYGRLDQTTCAFGRPASQVQSVTCTSSATKVSQMCNKKNRCSVMVSNTMFGDPCYGTYKYLEVAYGCRHSGV